MSFVYLVAILWLIAAIVAPPIVIFLLVRQSKLRSELNALQQDFAQQNSKFLREISELKRQIASATSAGPASSPSAEKPVSAEVRQPIPIPRSFPQVVIPPSPVVPPMKAPPTAAPRVEPHEPIKPPASVPPPPKPTLPPAAPPLKPRAPVAPPEPKPTTPIAPLKIEIPPETPHRPVALPAPPASISPAAARISTPPPPAFRVPAPKPTLEQRMKSVSAIEEALGASWFAILGVIMTVIGVALLGKLALQNLGPAGKCMILYAFAFALLAGSISLEKRERYRTLGRVGIGGGWGLLFFSTFGLYHVSAMHVLDSLVLDSVLMLAVAVAMAAHTLRYKSQFVTGVAFLLGYSTVALSQDTVYSLIAGVMLAIGLVGIVLKMGWFELEIFGILSSYLNHLYWLYRLLGMEGAHGRPFPEYHASLAMLFFYWLIFRISYVARGIKTDFEEHVSTVAAILNMGLLLGCMKFQSVQPELAYIALFTVGAAELFCGQLPITKRRREAFVVLTIAGAALILAAVPSHYSGNNVAILWLVGAEVFLAAGIAEKEILFRRIGLLTGLLVGVHLIFIDFRQLLQLRTKSEDLALSSGVLFALCALVLYLNALGIGSRWKEFFSSSPDRQFLTVHSYLGAFSAASATWALLSQDWTALAFAAIMLALAAFARRLDSRHLQIQYALLGILTLYRALVFNLHIESPSHIHITARLVTLPLLAAVFYATAKIAPLSEGQSQRVFRALFSFAGSLMIGFLIWFEAPETWIAALFLAAGILLAFAARRWDLLHLSIQEHLFAAAAVIQTLAYNCHVTGYYGPFSIRLVTVSSVAAGLYAISRRATNESASHRLIAAYLHTSAGTFLLALLMWYEASTGWVAPFWALFAFALAAVDRRFQLDDLRIQAHALSALTLVRCVGVNLYINDTWHGISVRLLSLSIVAVLFYAMSRLVRMPDEWRARDFHHIYSWSASLLVSLLLWYELQPLSIAVGLAVFGLVLFEYGLFRNITQFRYQAYVAFAVAFARIFFSNLTASEPGEFWGPRLNTVGPLVLIFFFVYAQLPAKEESVSRDRRLHFDAFLAYLGTATLAALFYFQFDPEWVVTSYASLALVLFAAASFFGRPIFLHQGILMTLGTFARGLTHNLFGSSYFTRGSWSGRYLVLSIAIAILFAALFFAFQLRAAFKASPDSSRRSRFASVIVGRPEQLQFFIPVILLTVMLALKTTAGMITVSWGIEAMFIVLFALIVRERNFLHAGFGLLLLCVAKVFVMDFWRFDLLHKVITFIGVGLATIAASLLYIRFRENLGQYL